jgi:hypothetical protein
MPTITGVNELSNISIVGIIEINEKLEIFKPAISHKNVDRM